MPMATLPELRRQRFLTQKALADLMGINKTMISQWETGWWRPNMEHFRKLCEVLEVGPNDIEFPEPKKEAVSVD
jgi:transcriptional regulator with XRE-family HTH domain